MISLNSFISQKIYSQVNFFFGNYFSIKASQHIRKMLQREVKLFTDSLSALKSKNLKKIFKSSQFVKNLAALILRFVLANSDEFLLFFVLLSGLKLPP